MKQIEETDYVLYKALSEHVIKNISEKLKVINQKCIVEIFGYERTEAGLAESKTYDEVAEWSKILDEKRRKLFKMVAVQDRLEKVLERNRVRYEFFKAKLESSGIYNDVVDKKLFSAALNSEKENVNEENLNLNPSRTGGVIYKFFAGEILAFKGEKPDFSLEYNKDVLYSASSSFFHELVAAFPSAVGTISVDAYISFNVKYNVLRESILYCASKIKTQTIKQSNAELGLPLAYTADLMNIEQYAKELKNYLNVCVKQGLKQSMPNAKDDIDALRCAEWSEFLPASRRVAPLSQGIAGDIPKTEAEVSEEVRKDQEKEAQKSLSSEELLKLLLADEDEETELQEKTQEDKKKIDEEIKLNKEKELQEEMEKMRELGLKKDDVTGY